MDNLCESCRYAEYDYTEYYGGDRQYFVSGCKCKNNPTSGEIDEQDNVTNCSEYVIREEDE